MALIPLENTATGIDDPPGPPLDAESYYAALTQRNGDMLGPSGQQIIRDARILIAGCGSVGGAAVEPLTRLGATKLVLADPDVYQISNLNRQNATVADVGSNKAAVSAVRASSINPHIEIEVVREGVTADNVARLVHGADVIIDGVDVTTKTGLQAKHLLNIEAASAGKPLITGWDMAGAHYIRFFDYRHIDKAFKGKLSLHDLDRGSIWHVLQKMIPSRFVPIEMLRFALENLTSSDTTFPQMVYSADLFGAVTSRMIVQILSGERVPEHTYIDVHSLLRPLMTRLRTAINRNYIAVKLLSRLSLPKQGKYHIQR